MSSVGAVDDSTTSATSATSAGSAMSTVGGAEPVRRPPFGGNPEVGHRGATTQRSILTAALSVFAEHGFHDTRVELITQAAGCSRPAFYQYFASKDDVFWRLAGHLARELARLVDQIDGVEPGADGVAALDRWIDQLVGLYKSYRPIFLSFPTAFREDGSDLPLPRSLTVRLRDVLLAADDRHRVLPESMDAGALAEAIVATVLRSIHHWLLGLLPIERGRFTTALASTVHRAVFGPIAGINAGPVIGKPAKKIPEWPAMASETADQSSRPRGVATRQKLLDAASQVLPRQGYHGTRVDDIVEDAGVSHGSFYRYFDSTDDLFRVLAAGASQPMVDLVDELSTAPTGSLHDWLTRWFDTYRSNGGVISAWEEIKLDDSSLTRMSLELVQVCFDRLQRLVHTRGFGDTTVDALVLLALLERVPYTVVVLTHLDEGPAIVAAQHIIERGILATTSLLPSAAGGA